MSTLTQEQINKINKTRVAINSLMVAQDNLFTELVKDVIPNISTITEDWLFDYCYNSGTLEGKSSEYYLSKIEESLKKDCLIQESNS